METKHIEVSSVRWMVCGVQEMLEPAAVTTIIRLGQSGWDPKLIVIVVAAVTLATRRGVLLTSFIPLSDRLRELIGTMSGYVLVALPAPLAVQRDGSATLALGTTVSAMLVLKKPQPADAAGIAAAAIFRQI